MRPMCWRAALAASLLFATQAGAAEIKVLASAALASSLATLKPMYEKASGDKIDLVLGTSGALAKRVADGGTADLIISTGAGIDGLIKDGKVVPGSRVDIARSGMGIAVKAGAPKPDISTPQALKAALLAAKSITYTDPKSGGASGIHFVKVLAELGIADAINAKAKLGQGGLTGELIVKGEAEMAVQQLPELKSVPGIDIVGPLPDALQSITLLSSGVLAGAKTPDTARAFVGFLRSPEGAAVLKDKGLEPGGPAKGAI
jgi:molybdate transport system substrate-binding protein